MTASEHIQETLFDSSVYASEPVMSHDEWVNRPNITFHGTFRDDWQDAPVLHTGSSDQAVNRMNSVARRVFPVEGSNAAYYQGTSSENIHELGEHNRRWEHTGRVHAIERSGPADFQYEGDIHSLTEPGEAAGPEELRDRYGRDHPRPTLEEAGDMGIHENPLSDMDANTTHLAYLLDTGHTEFEIPQSVMESTDELDSLLNYEHDDLLAEEVDALKAGKSVAYNNYIEGTPFVGDGGKTDTTSFLVPRNEEDRHPEGRYSTYDSYLAEHPSTSPAVKRAAWSRINSGLAGAVQFKAIGRPEQITQPTIPTGPAHRGPGNLIWNEADKQVHRVRRDSERMDVATHPEGTPDEGRAEIRFQ